MPLIPAIPPQPIPVYSGFDYVAVDAERRRVYAAHTGSKALLVLDADSGRVLGQVVVGPLHGVAVDAKTGHVYTGDGESNTVSEIDPEAKTVLRTANVAGEVDAVAYDPVNGHIYADEDDGTRVFVIDAKTMESIGTVALPGHKPEYLSVDPMTHAVYQNISDLSEFVVIDGTRLVVSKTVPTPDIAHNHPLQFDPDFGHVLVGGQNGVLAAYGTNGALIGKTPIQAKVDQCSLDRASHELACAGSGTLTLLRDNAVGAPTVIATAAVPAGAHTVGIDTKTGTVWIVWSEAAGDFAQSFRVQP
ncbi:MAG: YncE family protein [Candidatus Eremiobacteraeota bacterium]|nr:YncE family protein [Candidatus Eremiobacteraeota bacterium]